MVGGQGGCVFDYVRNAGDKEDARRAWFTLKEVGAERWVFNDKDE